MIQKFWSPWRESNSRSPPYQGGALPLSHMGSSWSGRRGSNSRPSAWKADALPIELLPHHRKFLKPILPSQKIIQALTPKKTFGGEGRIRTFEGNASRFTVCPVWPLRYLSAVNPQPKKAIGAGNGTRTRNLLITSQLLYQLSYASTHKSRFKCL